MLLLILLNTTKGGVSIKIAIMGAGLSGLACAITLEQHGINPVIFENRSQVGDRFVNGEILLSILSRPINDCIAYLADSYGIYLHPLSNIGTLAIHSKHERANIKGNLGFTNIRGREEDSFEKQLARQVKSKIHFNSCYTYEQLLQDYTHVVMATGDAAYASKIQNFSQALSVSMKGATVAGDFDRCTVMAWLNNELAPKGYAYLIPLSEKEANIVIAYPDYPENRLFKIDFYWDKFYREVCKVMGQQLKITDGFQISGYSIGICKQPRIGNTFFTGNCFGSIMPFLGFGQVASILTGIYAAHDLCGKGKYSELTIPLRNSYHNSLVLRRTMEKLSNRHFDVLVKSLKGPWGDRLFNSQRDFMKMAGYLLRPMVKFG